MSRLTIQVCGVRSSSQSIAALTYAEFVAGLESMSNAQPRAFESPSSVSLAQKGEDESSIVMPSIDSMSIYSRPTQTRSHHDQVPSISIGWEHVSVREVPDASLPSTAKVEQFVRRSLSKTFNALSIKSGAPLFTDSAPPKPASSRSKGLYKLWNRSAPLLSTPVSFQQSTDHPRTPSLVLTLPKVEPLRGAEGIAQ